MASFTVKTPYIRDKQILRSTNLLQKDRSVQITRSMLSRDTDGNYIAVAGSFIALNYDGTFRFLPHGYVVDPVTTASDLITGVTNSPMFLPGDVLTIQGAYALFDVSGTTAGSLTYLNVTYNVTPTGAGTAGEAAVIFAEEFAKTALSRYFYFVADEPNAQLYVFAKDGRTRYELTGDAVIIQGTVGGAAAAQPTEENTTAIGTVLQVVEASGDIQLTANAAIDVPAGIHIGAGVAEVYGLLLNSEALTDERPNYDLALASRAKVYKKTLPFYAPYIASDLPEIDARDVA